MHFNFWRTLGGFACLWAFVALALQNAHAVELPQPGRHGETQSPLGVRTSFKVWEPYSQTVVQFSGFPLRSALDKLVGVRWRKARSIVFVCKDGYRAVIEVERILNHTAWLADQVVNQNRASTDQPFSVVVTPPKDSRSTSKTILLGPYYLVWENLRDQQMKDLGDHGWPYQAVQVEIQDEEPLPSAWIPKEPATLRGYQHFKSYCLNCHALGKYGGKVGPQLLEPVGVTRYWKREWLERWIANPSSIRKGTSMPAIKLPGAPQDAATGIREIVDYLEWLDGAVVRAVDR